MIEKKVSEVEDRSAEITYLKKKDKKRKQSLRDLWDISKRSNTCVTLISQRQKDDRVEKENIQRNMAENSPNLVKDIIYKIKNLNKPQIAYYTKKTTSRHFAVILVKSKDKERLFKAARENNALHIRERLLGILITSHQRQWKPETVEHLTSTKRKKYRWIRNKDSLIVTTK